MFRSWKRETSCFKMACMHPAWMKLVNAIGLAAILGCRWTEIGNLG